jgi:hypothetical protein
MTGRLAGGTAARVGRGDVCAWLVFRITLGGAWLAACTGGMVDDAEWAGESPGCLTDRQRWVVPAFGLHYTP